LTRTSSKAASALLRIQFAFALAASAFFLPPLTCRAQQPQQESIPSAQTPIRSTTELVKVDVSVLDKHGTFVGGLEQKNFRIRDGERDQPIVFFTPVEAPAEVLVLVETSPAVYLIHDQHLFAAYALLDGLAADDQIALVTYDREPHGVLSFTADKSTLAAALGQIQYTLGMSELNFFDSVSAVIDWLAQVPGKKALVILSTGLDSSPPERWDALVQKLHAEDVVIFPVALGGSLRQPGDKKKKTAKKGVGSESHEQTSATDSENPLSFAKADGALLSLAKITGGRAYFPESDKDFAPAYREIAAALRHQYVLGIDPQHDGRFHSLTVQVLEGAGQAAPAGAKKAEYRIFAREGYLAPAP
jgi:VWFA-related protein